jgi:hypothetical protein
VGGSFSILPLFLSSARLVCASNMYLNSFLKDCYSVLKGISQAAGVAAAANHGLGSRCGAQSRRVDPPRRLRGRLLQQGSAGFAIILVH